MFLRLHWLLEIITIVICIHGLYGKKITKYIYPFSLISISLIILEINEYFSLNGLLIAFIYIAIAIYCILVFGKNYRALIINTICYIILMAAMQVIVAFVLAFFPFKTEQEFLFMFLVNLIVFMAILILVHKVPLRKMAIFLQKKSKGLTFAMAEGLALVLLLIMQIKKNGYIDSDYGMIIAIGGVVICYVCYQWQVSNYKKEVLLQNYAVYEVNNRIYQELLSEIKSVQHDYKNLINIIYCQHLTCSTYEELVNEQSKYCDFISQEVNKQDMYDTGSPVLTAYLYNKMKKAEAKGVQLIFKEKVLITNEPVTMLRQIEIIGNLLDNAIEATENNQDKRIYFTGKACELGTGYEVMNCIEKDEIIDLSKVTQKGYSTKGKNRGYGVYNIAKICLENDWEFVMDTRNIENKWWVCFGVFVK